MNFGQNLYTWLIAYGYCSYWYLFRFKREFSKLIGFLVVALFAGGVKDVLLKLFNKIIGA